MCDIGKLANNASINIIRKYYPNADKDMKSKLNKFIVKILDNLSLRDDIISNISVSLREFVLITSTCPESPLYSEYLFINKYKDKDIAFLEYMADKHKSPSVEDIDNACSPNLAIMLKSICHGGPLLTSYNTDMFIPEGRVKRLRLSYLKVKDNMQKYLSSLTDYRDITDIIIASGSLRFVYDWILHHSDLKIDPITRQIIFADLVRDDLLTYAWDVVYFKPDVEDMYPNESRIMPDSLKLIVDPFEWAGEYYM
jgi:hypothetical protein